MNLSAILHRSIAASALLALVFAPNAQACSDFMLNTTTDSVVSGRTMDFAADLSAVIEVIPRNMTFQELPVLNCADCPDYKWQSTYGFIGFNMFGVNLAPEGMNEKGLSAGILYLEGTEYPKPSVAAATSTTSPKPIVSTISLGTYILGNFATVDEVREGLSKVQIAEYDTRIGNYLVGSEANLGSVPLHMSIHDANGKSLAIEFLKGQVVFYDNVNKVLTNEPALDKQLAGLEKNGFDTYPGGYSPTERFIRLSVLNHKAPLGYLESASNASYLIGTQEQRVIADTLHILNTVVAPPSYEATQWSVVRDHGRKKVYVRTTANQALRQIDLSKFDFGNPASRHAIPVGFGNWFVGMTEPLLGKTNTTNTIDIPARSVIEPLLASVPSVASSINETSTESASSASARTGFDQLISLLASASVAMMVFF